MDQEFLKQFQADIEDKLGQDQFAVIADNMGEILTKNQEAIEAKRIAEEKISELQKMNEKLIASNGSLLKQIPMGTVDPTLQNVTMNEAADPEEFNIKDYLNPDGSFKED